mmetsp:Transcript_1795/g.4136  ORF Transcript_1795/g.4136 Transcript_1795/m.4136 type:complete len:272 (-) Transcript_1795:124-939(-)
MLVALLALISCLSLPAEGQCIFPSCKQVCRVPPTIQSFPFTETFNIASDGVGFLTGIETTTVTALGNFEKELGTFYPAAGRTYNISVSLVDRTEAFPFNLHICSCCNTSVSPGDIPITSYSHLHTENDMPAGRIQHLILVGHTAAASLMVALNVEDVTGDSMAGAGDLDTLPDCDPGTDTCGLPAGRTSSLSKGVMFVTVVFVAAFGALTYVAAVRICFFCWCKPAENLRSSLGNDEDENQVESYPRSAVFGPSSVEEYTLLPLELGELES